MPDPVAQPGEDAELRALVEQALQATYELEAEIGRGGMGIVYRARDRRLKRPVAIKLLPPELSFRRDVRTRFLREAETAAQLSHPNIVPIYSVDEVGNLVYFVMACVDGDNLARQLQRQGALPVEQVRRWFQEVAEALAYAHARGVIHRDIKPDNILVDAIDGRAVVTDFGIARAASDSGEAARLTATGTAIGTPAYMSPEQASGDRDLDARSDLYSLGVVAYQMLCGEPPFLGGTAPALLVKHLAEAPVPVKARRPDVPPDLDALVMRLLEKNPAHRLQSAGDVVQALRTGVVPPAPATAPVPGAGAAPLAGGAALAPRPAPLSGVPPEGWQRLRHGSSPIPMDGSPIGGMPMGAPSAPPAYQPPAYTARTGVVTAAGAGAGAGARAVASGAAGGATAAEMARWEAPPVERFRKKLGPYLIVNSVILVLAIISSVDLLTVTAFWSIFLAFQYSKLWTDGYDWRDVLRQPRHRELGDVLNDFGEEVEATFSARKREQLRARGHYSSGQPRTRDGLSLNAAPPSLPGATADASLAPSVQAQVQAVRQGQAELSRLLAALPARERAGLPTAGALALPLEAGVAAAVRELAADAAVDVPARLAPVDAEIAALEAEANPLDVSASEARVRRLAQLRRERRALREVSDRREARQGQLAACASLLDAMRVELVAWQAGGSGAGDAHAAALLELWPRLAEAALRLARPVAAAGGAALPPAARG